MSEDFYIDEIEQIIEKAKKRNLIRTYDEFVKTEESKEYALNEDEVEYYTSLAKHNETPVMKKFKIGDIVFVLKYMYKHGTVGKIIFL